MIEISILENMLLDHDQIFNEMIAQVKFHHF